MNPLPRRRSRRLPPQLGLLAAAIALSPLLIGCSESTADQTQNTPADATQAAAAPAGTPASYRCGSREIAPRTDGAIRIASYNILNLFDDNDDPEISGSVDDMFRRTEGIRAKPAEQQQAAADAIRAIDADILCLQEIESYDALIEFRDTYLEGMGYDHVASLDAFYSRGVEQSVLSRFPITRSQVWDSLPLEGNHPDDPAEMGRFDRDEAGRPIVMRRSPLLAIVDIPTADGGTEPLILFVVHHKSGSRNTYWRVAEVGGIAQLIADAKDRYPGAPLAVAGDFNAQPYDEPIMEYTTTVGLTDPFGARDFLDKTLHTHASQRTYDYIFIDDTLAKRLVEGSPSVYATPIRPLEYDFRSTPPPEGYASDHMPVTIDVRMAP